MSKTKDQINEFEKKVDSLRIYVDGKVEQIEYELSERVKFNEIRQNFQSFSDLLVVKFKQLEDTKQATRNIIAY